MSQGLKEDRMIERMMKKAFSEEQLDNNELEFFINLIEHMPLVRMRPLNAKETEKLISLKEEE